MLPVLGAEISQERGSGGRSYDTRQRHGRIRFRNSCYLRWLCCVPIDSLLNCARYIAYTTFAAAAVHRQRNQHKISTTQAKELTSERKSMQMYEIC